MKKKTLVTLITCLILVAAGVCYYVKYLQQEEAARVMTTLTDFPESGEYEKGNLLKNPDITDGINLTGAAVDPVSTDQRNNSTYKEPSKETASYGQSSGSEGDRKRLYVHLCGAVKKPAVYRVEVGTRLVDVITLAEGLTEDAAGDYINQATLIEDGQRIYIPTMSEVEGLTPGDFITGGDSGAQEKTSVLININQADVRELMELPGIGQAKADSIIAYRNANGTFSAIEELMNIPGIKEGLFGQIESYITVN